jgi:D-glycero-D-manno-heptose 1,7-bisphosphate phosphatase
MPLYLLDRDGVVVVNCRTNVKTPADIRLIPGAAQAIARLCDAGYTVGMCTNQPEVGRGVMSVEQLDKVHDALNDMLAREGGRLAFVLSATGTRKTPRSKPAGGMLREALQRCGAIAGLTSYVGDQPDDLKAALHAGCRRVLVRTGLGARSIEEGLPRYTAPVEVFDDLEAAVAAELAAASSSPRQTKKPPG